MSADAENAPETKAVAPEPAVPQTLKHFRLESLLARGGMGLVYRGYDTRLQRPVAVKLLAAELTSDPERRQRLLQEARAAARISHPAIAQIHYADEEAGVTFIVMELVEGKTVQELIRSGQLDLLGAVDIGIQVAEGLARAHERGIVHRDIKPANVMLTPDGHAKILDFGLAKRVDQPLTEGPSSGTEQLRATAAEQTLPGVILGTPAYMSPEQVRGAKVDHRTDIFSLGALLYEMVTGSSPFLRSNSVEAMHAVVYEDAPPLDIIRKGIPGDLQRIVSRCLSKAVEGRYADGRQLATELRRLRRDTEAGLFHKTSWQQRLNEVWDYWRHLPPSQYAWYGTLAVALMVAWYMLNTRNGAAGLIALVFTAIVVYRRIRNRLHRVQEQFVRKVSKIPEVRLIAIQDRQVTVVVDRPVAQLYGRINDRLRVCNRKLYSGQPMTASLLHDVSDEQFQRMLKGSGVLYVRPDTGTSSTPS